LTITSIRLTGKPFGYGFRITGYDFIPSIKITVVV